MNRHDSDELLALLSDPRRVGHPSGSDRAAQFLDAGEILLRALVDDPLRADTMGLEDPFARVLPLSRSVVIAEILRQSPRDERGADVDLPTDPMFRHRWRTQMDFQRDTVIWALRRRLPDAADFPTAVGAIDQVRHHRRSLPDALDEIATNHVASLVRDPAFWIQMFVEATAIARDERVAQALRIVDAANIAAWGEFWQPVTAWLNQGADTDRLAALWHVGIESVARTALSTSGSEPDQALGEPAASLLMVLIRGLLAPAE